jgi:hypothetical protein
MPQTDDGESRVVRMFFSLGVSRIAEDTIAEGDSVYSDALGRRYEGSGGKAKDHTKNRVSGGLIGGRRNCAGFKLVSHLAPSIVVVFPHRRGLGWMQQPALEDDDRVTLSRHIPSKSSRADSL